MKKIICIFILFALVNVLYLRKSNCVQATTQSSIFKENKKIAKEKTLAFNLQSIDSDNSNKIPYIQEKKRIKCIEPLLYCLANKYYHNVQIVEKNLYFPAQTIYFLRLFFSNEKRGPPSDILNS